MGFSRNESPKKALGVGSPFANYHPDFFELIKSLGFKKKPNCGWLYVYKGQESKTIAIYKVDHFKDTTICAFNREAKGYRVFDESCIKDAMKAISKMKWD